MGVMTGGDTDGVKAERPRYRTGCAGRGMRVLPAVVFFLASGCGGWHENEVYYDFNVSGIDREALPSTTLSIRCDGKEILSIDVSSKDWVSRMVYFPEDADVVEVYSADILVATEALRGVRNRDNTMLVKPVPDPGVYRPGEKSPGEK
jgi:hypothetical protein